MALEMDLGGKVILICGTARGGIGGATARQAAKAGATIVAVDKDQALLDPTLEDVMALGAAVHGIVANVADPRECASIVPQVLARFGRIDGVANVAGGTAEGEWMPLDETPDESFRNSLALNFEYVFRICRDAAREMIRQEAPGSLVNVSSVSSLTSAPWHGPYGAAKSAINALTRTMANEWHEFGIRANAVLPGAVATERVLTRVNSANVVPGSETNFTQPVELANAIVFLLSDLASGISGQSLTVDRSLSTKFCGGARVSRRQMAEA
ncbi:MAG: SDR family oxidoreductase [Novosphingobium sp.]|nr:SDR family oxidoreductase [Novosphingobium sp.]